MISLDEYNNKITTLQKQIAVHEARQKQILSEIAKTAATLTDEDITAATKYDPRLSFLKDLDLSDTVSLGLNENVWAELPSIIENLYQYLDSKIKYFEEVLR